MLKAINNTGEKKTTGVPLTIWENQQEGFALKMQGKIDIMIKITPCNLDNQKKSLIFKFKVKLPIHVLNFHIYVTYNIQAW